ncbi:MAG: [FeFe] hydrogenase H-cluster radical SAM maturase HydE, partial [Planctomycetes bacterium]|nr:[FeFe] hydrogenase H-cluster radical SAM maturase HydE [Planctomycetota bacterium]
DRGLPIDAVCDTIREIKQQTPLAVTLSLGERDEFELARLRSAGADRYLLRFETSNRDLFHRIHPSIEGQGPSDRLATLVLLRYLGFELGSGTMIGIPGQSVVDLARDVRLFAELSLDMIGVGPYVPHPATPLYDRIDSMRAATEEPAQADALTTYKMIALSRLVCPQANIPCTTALATVEGSAGYSAGLARGANVIMPNLTPSPYRLQYQIYPNKAGSQQTATDTDAAIRRQILAAGRTIGQGRGDAPNVLARHRTAMSI